ncbi:MAG: LamG domain-containing protein [Elusimicrobia bacterium]|nr:LamG domain-containing protein [Elusimicrobiota bacterium]
MIHLLLLMWALSVSDARAESYAYWPLDDGRGRVARAGGSQELPGEVLGTAAWDEGPSDRLPTSARFDGATGEVRVKEFVWEGGPITVSFWNRVDPGQERQATLFSLGAPDGAIRAQAHAPWVDGNLYWDYGAVSGQGRLAVPYREHLGRWTHVVLVSSGAGGGFRAVYIDGELRASAHRSDGPTGALRGLRIGRRHAGSVAEFRIERRVLAPAQIRSLYRATRPAAPRHEAWVSPTATGKAQLGTKENPHVADTAARFDRLMRAFADPGSWRRLAAGGAVIRLEAGTFHTAGTDWKADNWVLLSDWTLEGAGRERTTLRLDPEARRAEFGGRQRADARESVPIELNVVTGYGWKTAAHPIPRRQVVRGLTVDGQVSRFLDRYPHRRVRIQGVVIYGDGAAIENVRLRNLGSDYTEAFGGFVLSAASEQVPAGHVFGRGCAGSACAHISGCVYEGRVDRRVARSQLTVFIISGSFNSPGRNSDIASPGRVDLFHEGSYLEDNQVLIDDAGQTLPGGEGNLVQGFTLYNSKGRGRVTRNRTLNAAIGYYSDWNNGSDLVVSGNRFERAAVGISLVNDILPNFHTERVEIADNLITLIPRADGGRLGIRVRSARYDAAEDLRYYPPSSTPRYLKDFRILRNTISLAFPPSGTYYNGGIAAQEIDGLEISGNVLDRRLWPRVHVGPMVYYRPQGPLHFRNSRVLVRGNLTDRGEPAPYNDAEFVSQAVPARMRVGRPVEVAVTFRNTGSMPWSASSGHRLAAEPAEGSGLWESRLTWADPWGVKRVSQPAGEVVPPGRTRTFRFTVMPKAPGRFRFEWRMFHQGAPDAGQEWFGPLSPAVDVVVEEPGV